MTVFTPASSFGEILDRPGGFIRRHFKLLMTVAVVGNVIAVIPGSLTSVAQLLVDVLEPGMVAFLLVAGYGGALVGMVVQMTTILAVYETIRALIAGETVTLRKAYRKAIDPRHLTTVVLGWLATVIGLCLCIVPGLVVSVIMSIVGPVVIHESRAFGNAYRRATEILRYRPPGVKFGDTTAFRVVALFVLYWVLQVALTAVAWGPMVGISSYLGFRAASQGEAGLLEFEKIIQIMAVVTSVLQAALGSIAMIYILTCFTLLFLSAREKMEGLSIESALARRGFELAESDRLAAGASPS